MHLANILIIGCGVTSERLESLCSACDVDVPNPPIEDKLLQLYAVHKAMKEARKKGHLVTRNNKPTGEIKLVIQA